ncbi:cache domain-containing sensor histidine kinase [Paenibacillus methanolicus]|uniref:histidine kinase n=1 Tax=Paenibacillus methanolicus TaxID=582686 RepID=A0A5S5CJQ9_9BACL|nr:sensor histidine kinase [Paenibacillus methanolicus]TYP79744.1 two-component system sensor histidine kinase YesM [Paenibacillus methanolicus]
MSQFLRRQWTRVIEMRMERKLLLVFLLLVTMPLTFISYFSYVNYAESTQRTAIRYSTNMLEGMMGRVDDYIEDMVNMTSIPAYQDDIKFNLSRSNEYYAMREQIGADGNASAAPAFDQLLQIQRGIQGNVSFINNIKRGATSVYIFDLHGNAYSQAESGGLRQNLADSYRTWESAASVSGGEPVLLGTRKYVSMLNSDKYAFTVVRKIIDKALQPIGLIAVDADMSVIQDQIKTLDDVTQGESIIVDETGRVIYSADRTRMTADISDEPMFANAKGEQGSFYGEIAGERQLFIYMTSPNTEWKAIAAIPERALTKDSRVIRNVTLAATLATVALALLISTLVSFALTKPLRKMMQLMRTVQDGDFKATFQVRYGDEIGQLGRQFNRMIARIEELIQDIFRSESRRREAEMHALQSQINPHFMYNTLETIRMAAELNDDADAAEMIQLLGKQLRYSISNVNEEVTLERELVHIGHYVQLLNRRYPNRFRLQTQIPPELLAYPMAKLLLQPLVENATLHGLDDNKPYMSLDIEARQTDRYVEIRVMDDGLGMEPETLERLRAKLVRGAPDGDEGIGLVNVNERIKLHWGIAYGIDIESASGLFTAVTIRLPLMTAGRGEQSEISLDRLERGG